jgi:hypothetical protein
MRFFQWHKLACAVALAASPAWALTANDGQDQVDQDWSAAQKTTWYTLSQGSRLLPLSWFRALEQPDSDQPFLARSHTERFRYLVNDTSEPTPLPVGFAIDTQNDSNFSATSKLRWRQGQSSREPWVGMNCAACHTNALSYQGKLMRIEGAPTLADFQGYLKSLNLALNQTNTTPEKWARFAGKVLSGDDTPANRKALKSALDTLSKWQSQVEQANATDLQYGYARLDAFGHIFNKVMLRTGGTNQPRNPADAPVSYPFLWNIHQHDKVQWNGIAPNVPIGELLDIGALGRNVGEVIGVFADLKILPPGPAIGGYPNSAQVKNLLALEKQITTLKPPNWPAAFPPIDANKWEAGKALFTQGAHACTQCHQILERNDLSTPITARMASIAGNGAIGTDPWMACNAYTYQGKTGDLQWTPKKFIVGGGTLYGQTGAISDMLGTVVIGAIYADKAELVQKVSDPGSLLQSAKLFEVRRDVPLPELSLSGLLFDSAAALDSDKAERLKRCMAAKNNPLLAYKGRPLTGVWATPPFLHNGSVPSLYDLLLPENERPKSFVLGTREFDPQRVGYVNELSDAAYRSEQAVRENTFVFRSRDASGAEIAGNSNRGHDYNNAQFTEAERWALVEYMKAVGAQRVDDRIVP